ncbi:uncharacterized protein LOC112086029 [Eutrema salsugineum]|uniref:uncharacterized protein LOC112086029 n=1 Tax=Eutrema salsugineum TaxID=72664 RepID=UPI000CED6101|nr:uncharacterized protein LOC112086029 [Eutrema salsugineum]
MGIESLMEMRETAYEEESQEFLASFDDFMYYPRNSRILQGDGLGHMEFTVKGKAYRVPFRELNEISGFSAPKNVPHSNQIATRQYDDGGVGQTYAVEGVPDIFSPIRRLSEKVKEVWWSNENDYHNAQTYILLNCKELAWYESIFVDEWMKAQVDPNDPDAYPIWFHELLLGAMAKITTASMRKLVGVEDLPLQQESCVDRTEPDIDENIFLIDPQNRKVEDLPDDTEEEGDSDEFDKSEDDDEDLEDEGDDEEQQEDESE